MNATKLRRLAYTLLRTASLLACAGIALATAAEPFQIKGFQLGQPAKQACGTSRVTSRLGDLLAKYKSRAPDLVEMRVTECRVQADTFGGLKVDEGMDLLFLEDRLMQLKFELEAVHWLKYAEIFAPLEQMYGKPTIIKRELFTSHVWHQGNSTLSISRADNSSGVEALEIVLRDEDLFREYEDLGDQNSKILQAHDDEATKTDIRD